jgi:UPF0716 protein FxsA
VRWLLLLFFLVPLAELYLLLWTGSQIGFWPTVATTLAAAVLGSYLAKREGLKVWREWQRALTELRPPEQGVIDGVLVLVGSAFLIAPGFITDVAGMLMLFPPSRRVLARLVRRWVNRRLDDGSIRMQSFGQGPFGQSPFGQGPSGESAFAQRPHGAPRSRGEIVETSGESVDDEPEVR